MTNLVDVRNNKLYSGVTRINQVRFQEGTDRRITVIFNYNGGDGAFEVYVKEGVSSNNKAPFLIEVYELITSMINDPGNYITVEKIAERINEIEITDWARDCI